MCPTLERKTILAWNKAAGDKVNFVKRLYLFALHESPDAEIASLDEETHTDLCEQRYRIVGRPLLVINNAEMPDFTKIGCYQLTDLVEGFYSKIMHTPSKVKVSLPEHASVDASWKITSNWDMELAVLTDGEASHILIWNLMKKDPLFNFESRLAEKKAEAMMEKLVAERLSLQAEQERAAEIVDAAQASGVSSIVPVRTRRRSS